MTQNIEQSQKVISITIAYFDLGQGKDYVYHGITQFRGIHHGDILNLAQVQKESYKVDEAHEIYPEYWIIKVDKFNNVIQNKLDEWIYFLKNGELPENYSAKGLSEAQQKMHAMHLSDEEKIAYRAYLKRLRDIASEQHTIMVDYNQALKKAILKTEERKDIETVLSFFDNGVSIALIAKSLKITEQKAQEIIDNREEYERKLNE